MLYIGVIYTFKIPRSDLRHDILMFHSHKPLLRLIYNANYKNNFKSESQMFTLRNDVIYRMIKLALQNSRMGMAKEA